MSSEITVGDIMRKKVVTVNENDNIVAVSKLMKKHRIGSVVITQGKKAKGLVTERDIVWKMVTKGIDPKKVKAKEIMTYPLIVIKKNEYVEKAARAMKLNKIKRLPVINEKNELVGILTETDVAEVLPSLLDLIEEKSSLSVEL